jgi:hypothetical protein
MEFRFVNEHDPVALRRRRLQAQRTQRYRQRQKEKECIEPSMFQAELSQTVDSAADNVQTTLGNNLLANTGESRPDTISSGELPVTSSQVDENLSTIDTGPDQRSPQIKSNQTNCQTNQSNMPKFYFNQTNTRSSI